MNKLEQNLFRFHMLIPAIPFPFDGSAVAFNEESALQKIIFNAKKIGIKAWGPPIEVEKLAYNIK